jgi:ppGpp synthetase/RelA/SpoT-type nucleotidyltranferase
MLRARLEEAGIRSIVTSRATSLTRLEEKCRERNARKDSQPYASVDDIYSDIVDLAGVRVALYFPDERGQVGGIVTQLFVEWDKSREFPRDSEPPANEAEPTTDDDERNEWEKRFSGYVATHYRVRLRPQGSSDADQRYATANIEIQVASVLMHAWAEVDHDLVYHPYAGKLSEAEYVLLDQLNGLVIAGELSLRQLQRPPRRGSPKRNGNLPIITNLRPTWSAKYPRRRSNR